jgi:hypothetical protein
MDAGRRTSFHGLITVVLLRSPSRAPARRGRGVFRFIEREIGAALFNQMRKRDIRQMHGEDDGTFVAAGVFDGCE